MNTDFEIKLGDIINAIQADRVRISDHAKDEAKEDSLLLEDIFFSVCEQGAIIEQYPSDKPFPSCLILGKTQEGRPVHSVWAYQSEKKKAILITVYVPDPQRWIDFRQRRAS